MFGLMYTQVVFISKSLQMLPYHTRYTIHRYYCKALLSNILSTCVIVALLHPCGQYTKLHSQTWWQYNVNGNSLCKLYIKCLKKKNKKHSCTHIGVKYKF